MASCTTVVACSDGISLASRPDRNSPAPTLPNLLTRKPIGSASKATSADASPTAPKAAWLLVAPLFRYFVYAGKPCCNPALTIIGNGLAVAIEAAVAGRACIKLAPPE